MQLLYFKDFQIIKGLVYCLNFKTQQTNQCAIISKII